MIRRILYSSPLFSGIFWVGLMTLAIPLSWRIVTGDWTFDPDLVAYDSNATPAAVVVIVLWILLGYLHGQVRRHFARVDKEEAAAVAMAEPAPQPESSPPPKICGRVPPSQLTPVPRLGDLPPETMWAIYNHAMLLFAKDIQWRKEQEEREKREKREKPQP